MEDLSEASGETGLPAAAAIPGSSLGSDTEIKHWLQTLGSASASKRGLAEQLPLEIEALSSTAKLLLHGVLSSFFTAVEQAAEEQ